MVSFNIFWDRPGSFGIVQEYSDSLEYFGIVWVLFGTFIIFWDRLRSSEIVKDLSGSFGILRYLLAFFFFFGSFRIFWDLLTSFVPFGIVKNILRISARIFWIVWMVQDHLGSFRIFVSYRLD